MKCTVELGSGAMIYIYIYIYIYIHTYTHIHTYIASQRLRFEHSKVNKRGIQTTW
jgi:hypothetical protein